MVTQIDEWTVIDVKHRGLYDYGMLLTQKHSRAFYSINATRDKII
jgi:hypothetical protein